MTRESQAETASALGSMSADLAFTDLAEPVGVAGIDIKQFRALQIAAVMRNVPALMAANSIAASLLVWLAWGDAGYVQLINWLAMLVVVSAAVCLAARKYRRQTDEQKAFGSIDKINVCALMFSLLWALPPAMCLQGQPAGVCLLVTGIVVGAAGLGAFSLARVPSAALLYTSVLIGAMAASSLAMGGRLGIATSLFAITYGVALGFVIVGAHKTALLRAADAAEIERQREIIKLLLKDFEAGATDWLWETGPDGELVYVSDRLANILRRDRARLIGAKLHQAAGMPQSSSGWRTLSVLMASEQAVCELEVPVRRNRTTLWWQLTARPLRDASGAFRGYRGVGTDITAKRQAAIEMVRAKEAAERTSAAKSRFLATMSHELKTPLNAIVGFSEMIADEREGPVGHSNYVEYARNILDSSKHLASLINDILDITRIEKGSAILLEQDIDPIEVAEVVVKMCRGAARASDVSIVDDLSIEPVELRGDITRLQQILINLVNNAVKFTPAGGTVSVALSRNQSGGLEFVVTDTGIGIAKHELKRIFEPFVQVEDGSTRRFGGVGLGLAISRKLARLHGGDIVITSKPGKGTVARLVLPPSRVTPRPPGAANMAAA